VQTTISYTACTTTQLRNAQCAHFLLRITMPTHLNGATKTESAAELRWEPFQRYFFYILITLQTHVIQIH